MHLFALKRLKLVMTLAVAVQFAALAAYANSSACLDLFGESKREFPIKELEEQQRAAARVFGVKAKVSDTTVHYFPSLETKQGHTKYPGVREDSKAIVLAFGGAGTLKATGKTWMREAKTLQNFGVDLISIDYPFHGEGSVDPRYLNADFFIKEMFRVIKFYESSGKPVVFVGHSFGATVVKELIFRSNSIGSGAFLASPGGGITPALFTYYWANEAKIVKKAYGDDYISKMGGQWIDSLEAQFLSNKNVTTVNKKPVRIISGDNDLLNTPELLEDLRRSFSAADLQVYQDVTHLIFRYRGKNPELNLWAEQFLKFLNEELGISTPYSEPNLNAQIEIELFYSESTIFRQWMSENGKNFRSITSSERAALGALKEWRKWYSAKLQRQLKEFINERPQEREKVIPVEIRIILDKDPSKISETEHSTLIYFLARLIRENGG